MASRSEKSTWLQTGSKIHIFKKSAIGAGTPENYYLNPSENLWKIASEWSVVEHEDVINLTIHLRGIGDLVSIKVNGKFINIVVQKEHKAKAARFDHKDGMKNFSIEMNPNFVDLGVKGGDDMNGWQGQGIARLYISKLKK